MYNTYGTFKRDTTADFLFFLSVGEDKKLKKQTNSHEQIHSLYYCHVFSNVRDIAMKPLNPFPQLRGEKRKCPNICNH